MNEELVVCSTQKMQPNGDVTDGWAWMFATHL